MIALADRSLPGKQHLGAGAGSGLDLMPRQTQLAVRPVLVPNVRRGRVGEASPGKRSGDGAVSWFIADHKE